MKRYSLTPDALTTQGEGIARLNGKAIFVPFVLPGETCEAVIVESHKNFSRALPLDITHSNPESLTYQKADPPCPVFGLCGGCQLQHLDYTEQLRLKREWLIETFRRVAHLDIESSPLIASNPLSYRNKITLHIIEQNGAIELAYHQMYQPNRFVPVEDCPIAEDHLRELISPLRDALRSLKPKIKTSSKQQSSGSKVILRRMKGATRIHFEDMLFDEESMSRLHDQFIASGRIDEIILYLLGPHRSIEPMQLIREDFEPEWHIDSFLQVNDDIRENLYDYVLSLPYQEKETLIDGYCGVGILTCRMAEHFNTVIGIESDPHSSTDAQNRIERMGFENRVFVQQRNFEAFLFTAKKQYKTILLNPPRAGLSHEARTATLQHQPTDLVLISCHPAALARDAAHFVENGFLLARLQPFDMFPQTYHYEVVAHLQSSNR